MNKKYKFYFLLIFILINFGCIYNVDYLEPGKPIINAVEHYKIEKMPIKYEDILKNVNIKIEIYSFLDEYSLFNYIYECLNEGFGTLNYYLDFSNYMYKEKQLIFKVYVAIIEYNYIKNTYYKFKKEKNKNKIIFHRICFIEPNKEKQNKKIVSWAGLQIHEFSHYYFDKFQYKKYNYSFFEEGFAVYLEYLMRLKYKAKDDWMSQKIEMAKKDKELFKEVWNYKAGYLVIKHKTKIMLMRLLFISNEKIKKYIYDFWKHFDNLYYLSCGIVMTMENYYGKKKFKEILGMYRDGIEKEKLKKMAEEAIKEKWK